MISVETFLTHDNIFSLQVLKNGVAVDLVATAVSRVVVNSGRNQIDSAVDSAAFDYTSDGARGIIHFDFTDLTGLSTGKHLCTLTVFDALHPHGQVWADVFELTVNPNVVS